MLSHLSPASSSYTRERAYHSHRPAVLPHYRRDRDSLTALPPRSITRVDDRQQRKRYPTDQHADNLIHCRALPTRRSQDGGRCVLLHGTAVEREICWQKRSFMRGQISESPPIRFLP